LGRTQTIVYYLHELMKQGRFAGLPIYVDSPLAANATEVYHLHPECFDEETAKLLEDDPDLFGGKRIQYLRTPDESKTLNGRKEPCVIIASSGMCEAGRILHHLKHDIEDDRNTVLIVGFQAPDTLGRRLVEKQPKVRILDHWYQPRAEIVQMSGFSSHGDHDDLLAYYAPLVRRTRQVRLVHGESEQAEMLAKALREKGFADVAVPGQGETVSIG